MKNIKILGIALFLFALGVFTASLFMSRHTLTESLIRNQIVNENHQQALVDQAGPMLGKSYATNLSFISDLQEVMTQAREGLQDGQNKLEDYQIKNYLFALTKYSTPGPFQGHSQLAFWLSFVLGTIGALIYFLPGLFKIPGIKNDRIYHSSVTRGVNWYIRAGIIAAVLIWIVFYAIFQSILLLLSGLLVIAFIALRIYRKEKENDHNGEPARSASPPGNDGWIGIAIGAYLIGFYVLLYFHAYYLTNWVILVDPISEALSGYPASQWFLYGFLYSLVMLVMGIKMIIKYRYNNYQMVRTGSVIFFQLGFAFLLPEILIRLNQPYMDLKNAWPLNYSFFTRDQIDKLIGEGSDFAIGSWATSVGTMMFIWGIILVVIIVPLFTYIFGKRWYCSWVCGCGGLAETMGDPYRQLSDKSLRAWRIERFTVHGVLLFAVIMTGVVLYQYFSGTDQLLFLNAYSVKSWYGFMIGSMFAGVVGTGFYPLMGNRVWCRFGCPLAALLGLVQRFKSRFRITTNGGQCISCGNCSTYCEMGIDVRHYAQRGQNIVRASCVGCGICAAVCPRGVLRLENGSIDIDNRVTELKAIHISDKEVRLMA